MVFLAANQNIRMISEGSCDWSNDAKKSALIDHNKLHSQVNLKLFCVIAKYILNKLQKKYIRLFCPHILVTLHSVTFLNGSL